MSSSIFAAWRRPLVAGSLPVAALLIAAVASGQIENPPRPDFQGAVAWLNSPPLTERALRGKVVLVNFWTYSCINSLRELPFISSWASQYADSGLVVIGVHTPEFSFEEKRVNVENAVRELKIGFPVAIDSNHAIWQAFQNQYWPADYLIDGKGRIRYHHYGEGDYDQLDRAIQSLLAENGTLHSGGKAEIVANGIDAPPSGDIQSPETYVGHSRAERFVSHKSLANLALNQWGVAGPWKIGSEKASLETAPGAITFRFHARDLHMVLGPTHAGKPVRFRVKLDGREPGADNGVDTSPDGSGEVREPRLYQLIRQKGPIRERTFEIEFLDPGVEAFSFTFG